MAWDSLGEHCPECVRTRAYDDKRGWICPVCDEGQPGSFFNPEEINKIPFAGPIPKTAGPV